MKISVYDTYVHKDEGTIMHFDILVEESTNKTDVFSFGMKYLESKGMKDALLSTTECKFCHIETASTDIEIEIREKGFHVIEIENC